MAKSQMQKQVEKDEQIDLIEVAPENAKPQRLQDGTIKFEADNAIICVTPQEDLITIKEKAPKKKGKKSTKEQVEAEELEFEEKVN